MAHRSRSSDPDTRADGAFEGLIERNGGGVRAQAFNHNLGRNVRVMQVLTLVRLLRESGKKLGGSATCVAAAKQNFSARQKDTRMGLPSEPVAAAHFLPRNSVDRQHAGLEPHQRQHVSRPGRGAVWRRRAPASCIQPCRQQRGSETCTAAGCALRSPMHGVMERRGRSASTSR